MAGLGARDAPLVHGTARTGAGDTDWGGGLLGVTTGGTFVTLGESAVGGSLSNLREGAGKLGWTATGGVGRSAMGAEAFGEMTVTLKIMRESDCWQKIDRPPELQTGLECNAKEPRQVGERSRWRRLFSCWMGWGNCEEKLDSFGDTFGACPRNVNAVTLLVVRGGLEIPTFDTVGGEV